MSVHILAAMSRQDFEELIAIRDRGSGLRAFLGIHDSSAGPAFGGIRRRAYIDERQALLDCLRLSRAMTYKCAHADLPAGGAKLVILDHPELDREAAYRHIGEVVERLAGRFYTGPDVGTGATELASVAERTRFVTHPGPEGPGDLAEATAAGVFAGIAAALVQRFGAEDWPERRIVIQGLGSVGARIARRLIGLGAEVLGADLDAERGAEVCAELGLASLAPAAEFDEPCDVFAPCAMGGILHDLTVKRLRARIVAGCANNVLARDEHGDRLHARGVLYVPDFVINSGALIRGALFHLRGTREPSEEIERRIGGAVAGVLAQAAAEDLPPARVAVRQAEACIEERRRRSKTGEGVGVS